MMIVIDIKRFLEMTERLNKYRKLSIIAFWLDHFYGILPPSQYQFRTSIDEEEIWKEARMIEKENGRIPLTLPFSFYQIDAMDIRLQSLLVYVEDEDDFYRRNPGLWSTINISSKSRMSSGRGWLATQIAGLNKSSRLS